MANPNRTNKSEIEKSQQELLNKSFDNEFNVLAVEALVYNPNTGQLDRMTQPGGGSGGGGDASAANQTTEIARLTSIRDNMTNGTQHTIIDNASIPVTGTFWQATQPVSATDLTTIAGTVKTEDSVAGASDTGLLIMGVRQDADTTPVSASGDYHQFIFDEVGRLKVGTQPGSFPLVTGAITANAQTVFCDVSRASNVMIFMVATTLVGHNATFEGSLDSTNGTDGNWFSIQVIRSNANTIELTTGVLAATPVYAWEASVNGLSFIRVRATAHTSGTATWKFQRGSYATEPIPAAQISGTQPVSGTLTSAGTTTNTPATPTALNFTSAATTNATVVKASAGTLYGITLSNTNAAIRYVKLYNKATAPTVGTDIPVLTIAIPATSTVSLPIGALGHRFATGIGLATTTGAADTDTTAVALNEVKAIISFI